MDSIVCFNISISTQLAKYCRFLLSTDYMQKLFNTAFSMFMSKKYLFLSPLGCSKVHFGLEIKTVENNSVYFSILS